MTLGLPTVSLCCIDTRFPDLAEYSLHKSVEVAQIEFGDVILFTSAAQTGFRRRYGFPLKIVEIPELRSKLAYSRFVIHDLPQLIDSEHVLITQWDSFVLNASAWRADFLACDYIGAPWPWLAEPRIGNGGFSLRSRRLLQAARASMETVDDNEDLLICRTHRGALESKHGVRFADEATATRFAFERGAPDGSNFGFHGLFNFDKVLDAGELDFYCRALPEALALSQEGAELAAQLFNAGQRELGKVLVQKRLRANARDDLGRGLARQMWDKSEPCWCGSGQPAGACHEKPAIGAPGAAAAARSAPPPAHDRLGADVMHADVLRLIPPNLQRVVEVGSRGGALAQAYLQSSPATEYIGIEADAALADASARHCVRVVQRNIEELSDAELRALGRVDCWVLADTLANLYDPWRVLKRLRAAMQTGDCLVACLPNVQHWSVLTRLLSGNLWYEEAGLLDRAHIRFFTRSTLVRMFEECGLRIEAGAPRIFPLEHQDQVVAALRVLAQTLGMNAEQCARDALVWQHVVRAVPA